MLSVDGLGVGLACLVEVSAVDAHAHMLWLSDPAVC